MARSSVQLTTPAGGRSACLCPPTPAAYVRAAGVGLHLLFLVSLRTGWLNPLFNDSMHRFGPGCDFFSIYAAGVKARMGESVYTIGDRVDAAPYAYAFRYAPVVAYKLGLGLSLLPNLAAYAAWLIGCELALLRNIRLTAELAPDRNRTVRHCQAQSGMPVRPMFTFLFADPLARAERHDRIVSNAEFHVSRCLAKSGQSNPALPAVLPCRAVVPAKPVVSRGCPSFSSW